MLSLSFPDSAGISGSFPLHLPLQKAPGLRSALPPVFVGLSLHLRPLSPLQKSSRVSCHLFLFSPGSHSTVTSDLPLLFLRGWGKTWPTFAWCQFSSPGLLLLLLLLPRGRGSCCRTASPPFSSWLGCSWRDWFEQIWAPLRRCSIEFASPSLPPAPARLGKACVTFPPFPLPSAGKKASSSW